MSDEAKINTEKRNFDQEAARWDQAPGRVKLAQDIAHSLMREITLTPDMDVLDFGCGTGLLTFALQPLVRSITGVDSSQGMLDVFKTKIKGQNLNNVRADYIDLDRGDILPGSYHLVVSSMTLHHIKNITSLLKQFYSILLPSGRLVIADLDSDEGLFHSSNEGVFHAGFDRNELCEMFIDAGFRDVRHRTATQVEKSVEGGRKHTFSIFLINGCK